MERPPDDVSKGTVRIAVLGVGSIGTRHIKTLRDIPGVLPVAVPARRESLARAHSLGVETYATLAEAGPCDGVVVATDTQRHVADAAAAMRHARPNALLVEKPIAADHAAAASVKMVPGRVFAAFCLRFDDALLAFRERLPLAGRLHHVQIEARSYLPDWRPGRGVTDGYWADPASGGVLRDLCHEVDYAMWLFGKPRAVWGRIEATGRLGIPSDDVAQLAWRSGEGAGVSVGLDYLSRTPIRSVVAYGEKGTLEADLLARRVLWRPPDGPPAALAMGPRDLMYARQAAAFVEAARGGPGAGLATWSDGLAALAVCDAARQASAEGREVEVAP